MDEFQKHHVEGKKPYSEECLVYASIYKQTPTIGNTSPWFKKKMRTVIASREWGRVTGAWIIQVYVVYAHYTL